MQALGDKIGSTIIAQSAGVPTIAWNGDDLRVDYTKDGIPDEVYAKANVVTAEEALECVARIGVPVMIKASEGGGGKGIRKVTDIADVPSLFRAVQAEVPGSPIFVMKMATKARHLEVQLLADRHGDAIALSGRDCSVQRRHQKIIEEGPPVAAPKEVFRQMERAAVALAKAVGYSSAGTVEYLYMEDTQEFAFLELNPRLQVEHPVTENILGINLPACQLQVAMGLPLHTIHDIRRLYGRNPDGRDTIDFDFSERVDRQRHCIAVRVTAENPSAGFQPTSGKIEELQFRSSIDVWGYFSIDNSGNVHEFADSQFGHIFASGSNRESARQAMIVALKELQIRGAIDTTVEYIIKMMQSTDFIENKIDTAWLDGRIADSAKIAREEKDLGLNPTLVAVCGAVLQGYKHFKARCEEFVDMLSVGQIPSRDMLAHTVPIDLIYLNTKYSTTCTQSGASSVTVRCNGASQDISLRALADGGYLIDVAGKSHLAYSRAEQNGSLRMILDGHTCIFTPEYDPTKLTSSVAGKIARLLVADGSHLTAGDPYVEIEVMKMYMPLKVAESGSVHFLISEGAALTPGDLIATMELDSPDKVVMSEPFLGSLVVRSSTGSASTAVHPHVAARIAESKLERILDGYILESVNVSDVVDEYMCCLREKLLPFYEVEEALAVLRGRIDANLTKSIIDINSRYRESVRSGVAVDYPAAAILTLLQNFSVSCAPDKRVPFVNLTSALWNSVEKFVFSENIRLLSSLLSLTEKYLAVETRFDVMSFTDVVSELRKQSSMDPLQILNLCRSHVNIRNKNALIIEVIEEIKDIQTVLPSTELSKVPRDLPLRNKVNVRNLKLRLSELAKLRHQSHSHVSLNANLILMEQYTLSVDMRRLKLNEAIVSALTTGDPVGSGDRVTQMKRFVDSNIAISDLLLESLRQDREYQIAVVELYVRKVYNSTHHLRNFSFGYSLGPESKDSVHSNTWLKFELSSRHGYAAVSGSRHASYASLASSSNITPTKGSGNLLSFGSVGSGMFASIAEVSDSHASWAGLFVIAESYEDAKRCLPHALSKVASSSSIEAAMNDVIVVIMSGTAMSDDSTAEHLSEIMSPFHDDMTAACIRRITFLIANAPDKHKLNPHPVPTVFTFRSRINFAEDRLCRHIIPPHAFYLDLPRLSNYNISLVDGLQTSSGNVHLYRATPTSVPNGSCRYFARLISFTANVHSSDAESLFVEALDHLALVVGKESTKEGGVKNLSSNHVFLSIIAPDTVAEHDYFEKELRRICTKYSQKMVRLAISQVEIKLTCRLAVDSEPLFMRLVAMNPTGFVLRIDRYFESVKDGMRVFSAIGDSPGEWDGLPIDTPYPVFSKFERQRADALASSDTLFVYDWPLLFEQALACVWEEYGKAHNSVNQFMCQELVLCNNAGIPLEKGWTYKDGEVAQLTPIDREMGQNDVGMVAWLLRMVTPECPEGRQVVVICNDITFEAGSFGTREDMLFFKASEYARVNGLPRLFLTANSGARIGMAQSLKSKFQISWSEPSDPSKGFKYIYLTKQDYEDMLAKYEGCVEALPLICTLQVGPEDEERYVITDIIGEEPDLGVENLMGSGLIAGETSKAYDEIFTLTLVVGRTVGIGAYLVRLGQRTIQKNRTSPIILTGYQALNKLMGREIYTTNDQLGGPMIMFPNGVSHQLAESHMDSVMKALSWLSFVPASNSSPLPILNISGIDSVYRQVAFTPQKGLNYDPRLLLNGITEDDQWTSGFLDKNSFIETLGGWAKTVIVGRGRLGGIPIGVIVTENRTAEATKPADPADLSSQEKMVQQAGGVWFPDSAYKTAQALKDFNRERLPCIILANWRGFSGGQRDMFDEVLKFGSMIVDALVAYRQPLFVYIPPHAELRGGAWVVVDSTINSDVMEFYAAEDARLFFVHTLTLCI